MIKKERNLNCVVFLFVKQYKSIFKCYAILFVHIWGITHSTKQVVQKKIVTKYLQKKFQYKVLEDKQE